MTELAPGSDSLKVPVIEDADSWILSNFFRLKDAWEQSNTVNVGTLADPLNFNAALRVIPSLKPDGFQSHDEEYFRQHLAFVVADLQLQRWACHQDFLLEIDNWKAMSRETDIAHTWHITENCPLFNLLALLHSYWQHNKGRFFNPYKSGSMQLVRKVMEYYAPGVEFTSDPQLKINEADGSYERSYTIEGTQRLAPFALVVSQAIDELMAQRAASISIPYTFTTATGVHPYQQLSKPEKAAVTEAFMRLSYDLKAQSYFEKAFLITFDTKQNSIELKRGFAHTEEQKINQRAVIVRAITRAIFALRSAHVFWDEAPPTKSRRQS